MKTQPQKTPPPSSPAAQAVEELERIELGADLAAATAQATTATASLWSQSMTALFRAEIVEGHAFAAAEFYLSRLPAGNGYGGALADVHGRALAGGFHALADLLRAPELLGAVASHASEAAGMTGSGPRDRAAAATAAQREFALAVARQLVSTGGDYAGPASELILAADLEARLGAVRARHEAHAAELAEQAEQARLVTEQEIALEKQRVADGAAAELARIEQVRLEAAHATQAAKNDALAASLRRMRGDELRIGGGRDAQRYSVRELLRAAEQNLLSLEQAVFWTAAVAAQAKP